LSQRAIADQLGLSQQSWQGYESGKTTPPAHVLQLLTVGHQVNLNWLLTGSGPVEKPYRDVSLDLAENDSRSAALFLAENTSLRSENADLRRQLEEVESKPTVRIPIYDIPASAGDGDETPSVEIVDALVSYGDVILDWLVNEVRANPDKCFIVRVKGDSMYDFLNDGDLVLCEHQDYIDHDGVFVVSVNGNTHIKRVARGAKPQSIDLISHNTFYPTRTISEETGDVLYVHGRYLRRIIR
jgi:phage repressor protein C with HTH and peptisase S24 domain